MRKRRIDEGGFSFLEIVVVLAIIFILVAALVPVFASRLEQARIGRAKDDVQVIAVAMGKFYMDTAAFPVWKDGSNIGAPDCQPKYEALASADGEYPAGLGDQGWSITKVDTFENQLILNAPNYPDIGANCWRGPYLGLNKGQRMNRDPWGNKYLANVRGFTVHDVVVMVISAGPDEKIETKAHSNYKSFQIGGDDIVCVIR